MDLEVGADLPFIVFLPCGYGDGVRLVNMVETARRIPIYETGLDLLVEQERVGWSLSLCGDWVDSNGRPHHMTSCRSLLPDSNKLRRVAEALVELQVCRDELPPDAPE